MSSSSSVLDTGTGGGERFLQLQDDWRDRVVVTERGHNRQKDVAEYLDGHLDRFPTLARRQVRPEPGQVSREYRPRRRILFYRNGIFRQRLAQIATGQRGGEDHRRRRWFNSSSLTSR